MRRYVWMCLAPVLLAGCGSHGVTSPQEPPYRPPSRPDWPAYLSPAPAWSSQGLIAYHDNGIVPEGGSGAWTTDTALVGLWTIDPATGARTRIPNGGLQPSWSPDGQRLLFAGYGASEQVIVNVRADGGDRREITSHGWDWEPDWSSRDRVAYRNGDRIRLVDPDGAGDVDLAPGAAPDWHPDGTHLVFNRDFADRVPPLSMICVMTPGAGAPRCLMLASDTLLRSPRYSPDGARIAFCRAPGRDGAEQIWVMHADGTGARPVTVGSGREPAWSPDGTRLVFVRDGLPGTEGFDGNLWIVEVATGAERQLTSQASPTRASPR